MITQQVVSSCESAFLLISRSSQQDITLQLHAVPPEQLQRHRLNRRHPLHVQSSTTPNKTIPHNASKRVNTPLLSLGSHNIQMRKQQQAGLLTRSLQARNDAASAHSGLENLTVKTILTQAFS